MLGWVVVFNLAELIDNLGYDRLCLLISQLVHRRLRFTQSVMGLTTERDELKLGLEGGRTADPAAEV